MTTLTDFLLARIAEDEDVARHCKESGWITPDRFDWPRVLAECEAKRRIVEGIDGAFDMDFVPTTEYAEGVASAWAGVLALLSLPYADHGDFREEWRP